MLLSDNIWCILAHQNLPAPEVLAQEIVEQLEAALEEFRDVEEVLATDGDSE